MMTDLRPLFEEILQHKRHIDELEKDLQVCREQLDACIRNYTDTVQHLPNPSDTYEKFFAEIERIIDCFEPEEIQSAPTRRW